MKNTMKCLSIIMVMILMMLAACAQENTSNSGESANTGIVGKWKEGYGDIGNVYEFKSDHTVYAEGYNMGDWYGNDVSGQVNFNSSNGTQSWTYELSGNSLTLTHKEDSTEKMYFTRI